MNPANKTTAFTAVTLAFCLCLAAACTADRGGLPVYELRGETMGTSFSIKVVEPPDGIDMARIGRDVEAEIFEVETRMSTYNDDSEISRFNRYRGTDWFAVSAVFCDTINEALRLAERTGGAFDVTVGPVVNLWGFGPTGRIEAPPDASELAERLALTGRDKLHADCTRPAIRKDLAELYVDLSAYAKGYAVDRAAAKLHGGGLTNFLVEIGGEIRAAGHNARRKPWSIAVERPVAGGRSVQSVYELADAAMATSGDYRNFFEHEGLRYSHTIDPRTGRPVRHDGASVTVIADTAADADGLATALLVMGPVAGFEFAERQSIAAYFLIRDGDGIAERETPAFLSRTRPAPGRDRQ